MLSRPLMVALVASSLLAACGQVLLKIGATNRHFLRDFLNLWIIAGFSAYLLGVVLWVYALSRVPLTVVYPFTALTFVVTYVAGLVLLRETVSVAAVVGIGFILSGLYLTAR